MPRAVSIAALDSIAACLEPLRHAQRHGTLYETTGDAFAPHVYCEGVHRLIAAFSKAIHLEGFDWPTWHAGEGAQWFEDPARLTDADLMTLSRILVTIVRSERYVGGAIAGHLESGLLFGVLERVLTLRDALGAFRLQLCASPWLQGACRQGLARTLYRPNPEADPWPEVVNDPTLALRAVDRRGRPVADPHPSPAIFEALLGCRPAPGAVEALRIDPQTSALVRWSEGQGELTLYPAATEAPAPELAEAAWDHEAVLCLSDGRLAPLTGAPWTVGSAPESDLVLTGEGVAPRHATLTLGCEGWSVERLDGAMTHNGEAIDRAQLQPGDTLTLGAHTASLVAVG